MKLGGPGRDGYLDAEVPDAEWAARGGTLQECFANGADDSMIEYHPDSETLSGVYRCEIGDMIGELEVGINYWEMNGEIQTGYVFRMLDSATAAPMRPIGVFGH
jgi:hypothetical protein